MAPDTFRGPFRFFGLGRFLRFVARFVGAHLRWRQLHVAVEHVLRRPPLAPCSRSAAEAVTVRFFVAGLTRALPYPGHFRDTTRGLKA